MIADTAESPPQISFSLRRKRLLDLLLLLPALPFYLVLLSLLMLLVRLFDGAPIFFFQQRAGRARRPFRVFKLRTMTLEKDPRERRPTRLGSFLRKRGLDELPQLLNVLRSEMSLVGPRPLALEDAERLVADHPPFARRFQLPPGLTGPAQIRNLRGVQQTAQLESDYATSRSAPGDMKILVATAWINLAGKPKSTQAIPAPKEAAVPPRRTRLRRFWLWPLLALAIFLGGWSLVGSEVNRLRILKETRGPAAFSTVDLLSASMLNVVMAAGGFIAGYPEVAEETLLLFFPAENRAHDFKSDFAMRAPEVRAAARSLLARLDRGEENPTTTATLDAPLAVRLAFSIPFKVSATRHAAAIIFTIHTHIIYPQRCTFPLGPSPIGEPILFDEGIYWALQKRGWFHPYEARWSWMLDENDPRLEDRTAAPSAFRERATVAIWRALLGLKNIRAVRSHS